VATQSSSAQAGEPMPSSSAALPPESYADDSVDWDAVAAEVEEAMAVATQQVSDIVTIMISLSNRAFSLSIESDQSRGTLEGASRRATPTVHLTAGTVFTTSDLLGDEVSAEDYDLSSGRERHIFRAPPAPLTVLCCRPRAHGAKTEDISRR